MKQNKLTVDEINDLIRKQVNEEIPRPAGGFETDEHEEDWRRRSDARFFELSRQWGLD